MRVERFTGRDVAQALQRLRDRWGEEALVLRTSAGRDSVEIVATTSDEVERFDSVLRTPLVARGPGRRSRIIALVGPTGSGKSTTAAKLALSDSAFAGARVGLISLDTYKIGAFDQIQTYADLAGLALEVLSDPAEVPGAAVRLRRCDIIIVDTPGRTPNASPGERSWRKTLAKLLPDEVHLVVPAGVRYHVADAIRAHYQDLGLTHLLLTKLDEVPGEAGVAQLADRLALPTRWVTDGQVVPDDLDAAPDRLVNSALTGNVVEWLAGATG